MIKEHEIRPKKLYDKYLKLSREDAQKFDKSQFCEVNCPGCGIKDSKFKFNKNGFNYVICNKCGSLYCSPRPSRDTLEDFYQNSKSSNYWSKTFYPAVAETRRKKIFKKKAEQIYHLLKKNKFKPKEICDVGAGYGILLEELQHFLKDSEFFAIEPNQEEVQICKSKNFQTLETTAEDSSKWHNRFDMVISSEVIEHVYSTFDFVDSLYNLITDNGYCLVTGLGFEGFDILTLQKNSNSIFPPHHLNFLSIDGFKRLFHKFKFSDVQVWTPGELDVNIVLNSPYCTDFIKVLSSRGEKTIHDFQKFLQKNNLSSHVWIWACK